MPTKSRDIRFTGLLAAGFIRQDLPFKNCNVANILQALFQNLISVAALNSMC
ncbi:hypothetical protein T4D_12467 [Trichinella pseudospiralis]|uniref:Uncharacterized protein n=1 Tax=Trichinella pseudospiralis TaxID=6337 RepID=A0A0V1DND5_TRIPS|nr:hypothetical protein T4D_12467 [Trichinella pseudospiralis]